MFTWATKIFFSVLRKTKDTIHLIQLSIHNIFIQWNDLQTRIGPFLFHFAHWFNPVLNPNTLKISCKLLVCIQSSLSSV